MRLFEVLDPDMRGVVERVSRGTARQMVRDGCAAWCGDRPAIRRLRTFHGLRDKSASPGRLVIEANATGAGWAKEIVTEWAGNHPPNQ